MQFTDSFLVILHKKTKLATVSSYCVPSHHNSLRLCFVLLILVKTLSFIIFVKVSQLLVSKIRLAEIFTKIMKLKFYKRSIKKRTDSSSTIELFLLILKILFKGVPYTVLMEVWFCTPIALTLLLKTSKFEISIFLTF